MTLAALILPLVVPQSPVITVQLRMFEVPRGFAFTGPKFASVSEDKGNTTVFFHPKSPTETQLIERAKKREILDLGSPVVRTLSGQSAQVETVQAEGEGDALKRIVRTLKVLPTLAKNGSITVDVSANFATKSGEMSVAEIEASANFATRPEQTVFIVTTNKQDRKRSLLIAVRVSAS